jgi:hypothetical protein
MKQTFLPLFRFLFVRSSDPCPIASRLGADTINIARGFMLSMGCIQAMSCHTNRCPTGITTHSESLQGGLDSAEKGVRVANYALNIRKELMLLVRSMGLRSPGEIMRHHVFVYQDDRKSVPLSDLWPYPRGCDPLASSAPQVARVGQLANFPVTGPRGRAGRGGAQATGR